MRLGRMLSQLALAGAVAWAMAAGAQQWPVYNQQLPQADQYGYNQGYSSRISQQPVVEYADPNSAILQWTTQGDFNTFVRIGTDPNNLSGVIRSSGKENPHTARISGQLQAGQVYFFQVFDPSDNPLTPVLAFRTPLQGSVRGIQPELASNMAYNNGYNGYGNNGYRDRDRDRQRADRDYDRDRDRDQYGNRRYGDQRYGNQYGALPQSDYNGDSNAAVDIVSEPRIRGNGSGSATVTWTTNVPSSAIVHYGSDPNNLNMTAEAPWGGTTHTVQMNNLQPGQWYYAQVESAQAQGSGTKILSPVVRFRAR